MSHVRRAQHRLLPGLAGSLLLLAGCTGDTPGGDGTDGRACNVEPTPPGCGAVCGPGKPPCATGLYCSAAGLCTADCGLGGVTCPDLQRCTRWGRCEGEGLPPGDPTDGGSDGPIDATTRDASTADAAATSDACTEVTVAARPRPVDVVFVVDQSASMGNDFGVDTRWNTLRQLVTETPGGVIHGLQSRVGFGLTLFTAESGPGGFPDGACPRLTNVSPALENLGPVKNAYDGAEPVDDSPAGDALQALLDRLGSPSRPTHLVLVLDGTPERCERLDRGDGGPETVAALTEAYDRDIPTDVIAIGNGLSDDLLTALSRAGRGGDPDAPVRRTTDATMLADALDAAVIGALPCEVDLERALALDEACGATVTLDGTALPCNADDGWRTVDGVTLELLGAACEAYRQPGYDERLSVTAPCNVLAD